MATCLSPVFVQIGAIPNFTATNPTLLLPGMIIRCKDTKSLSQQEEEPYSQKTCYTPSVHSCRCQGSSFSGLSFEAVCLSYSSAILFLIYSLLSSVRCSSNHVVVVTVLIQLTNWEGLQERSSGNQMQDDRDLLLIRAKMRQAHKPHLINTLLIFLALLLSLFCLVTSHTCLKLQIKFSDLLPKIAYRLLYTDCLSITL